MDKIITRKLESEDFENLEYVWLTYLQPDGWRVKKCLYSKWSWKKFRYMWYLIVEIDEDRQYHNILMKEIVDLKQRKRKRS
jgi:hypothetical protein